MTNKIQNDYNPDVVSPPGETLSEILDDIDMSQVELAKHMERTVEAIHTIIQGNASITTDIASQLERILHVPASFWLIREQLYRESLTKQRGQYNNLKRRLS
jgi:HTH-type transcriptional regulator / antitoxin HigA